MQGLIRRPPPRIFSPSGKILAFWPPVRNLIGLKDKSRLNININMSAEEIKEYMNVYLELMLVEGGYPYKEGDARLETNWYINWKKTGVMDPDALSNEQLKKLRNKHYQLKKGNLDQSFLIWRLMYQKQVELNVKHESKIEKLQLKINSLREMKSNLIAKLNNNH